MSWFQDSLKSVMGFCNLLEPDRKAISITKSAVWIALGCLIVSVFRAPENFGTAVAGLVPVLANYAHRYGRRPFKDSHDQPTAATDDMQALADAQAAESSSSEGDVQPTAGAS